MRAWLKWLVWRTPASGSGWVCKYVGLGNSGEVVEVEVELELELELEVCGLKS